MLSTESDIIDINDRNAQNARLLASSLSEAQIRKRGMIDILGIFCAIDYLQSKKIKTDISRSIFKIPALFEEFKVSDIYYGNYRIDVITLYREKTIKIPKIHVDMDILPSFYFVLQIGISIKEAKIIGFIDSKSILNSSHDSKFYYPTLDKIIDLNSFLYQTKHSLQPSVLLGKHVDCMGLFLKFIDKDLSSVYKKQLIQHLLNCDSCRSKFIDMMEFEKIANNLRFYPDLIRKSEQENYSSVAAVNIANSNKTSLEESLKNVQIENINQSVEDKFTEINPQKSSVINEEKEVQMFDVGDINKSDTKDTKNLSKKTVETIFNNLYNNPKQQSDTKGKKTHIVIVSIVVILVLSSFVLISKGSDSELSNENTNKEENFDENFDSYQDDYLSDDSSLNTTNYPSANNTYNNIPRSVDASSYNINQPVSKASYTPTITRISWEAPENLTKKGNYTKFLQLAGKNIKLNLQNDLLLVNDIPTNKSAKIDIKIASNGDVKSINIVNTSGSDAIDQAILRVIKDTLIYMKPPTHSVIAKPVCITLSLELS